MKHEMKLNNWPFERIKNVAMTIELRLNGEKINFSDDIKILCKKTSVCSEAISKTKNLLEDTSFYSSCN